jgi:hypothetical protein
MAKLQVSRTLAEVRWQNRSRAGTQARLFSRQGEMFAAQRLHMCQLPATPSQLKVRLEGRTTEFGQKVFIGLLTLDPLTDQVTGPGLGISIDPETGMVEDLIGAAGVVGYLHSAPQEVGADLIIGIEAWIYGRTFIPRLHLNGETVALPAFLTDPGQTLTALAGGEIGAGVLPRIDHTELTLRPLADEGMANG